MPTYLYECPVHGRIEVVKRMRDAGRDECCRACMEAAYDRRRSPEEQAAFAARIPWKMRRVYTPPVVQNLTASENTLRTWGRDLRVDVGVTDAAGLLRARRARDEALAREGAPPPRAATIDE